MSTEQHYYSSGVFHDTPLGEAIPCCDKPMNDPVHLHRPPERVCSCDRLAFRHYAFPECPA